jgi:mRNA-degrading endonuclease RelE of RelBE toxin-antitoxin system
MTTNRFKKVVLLPEFVKDLKKLRKRFKSLEEDLKIFVETALYLFHKLNRDNNGIFHIPGLKFGTPRIYKAKKFACRALKGSGSSSGIRIIYSYDEKEDKIELIEIYFKGDKENEDKNRINRIYGQC